MKDEQKVVYEPHPVSPERKAELRAQGLKIIDAAFAPEGEVAAKPAKPQRNKPKADEAAE